MYSITARKIIVQVFIFLKRKVRLCRIVVGEFFVWFLAGNLPGTLLCLWGCQTDLAGCALDAGIITRKTSVRDKSSEGGGGVVKVMRGFIRGRHQF